MILVSNASNMLVYFFKPVYFLHRECERDLFGQSLFRENKCMFSYFCDKTTYSSSQTPNAPSQMRKAPNMLSQNYANQSAKYADQNTKYTIPIKRINQPKHQIRYLNQKNTPTKSQSW